MALNTRHTLETGFSSYSRSESFCLIASHITSVFPFLFLGENLAYAPVHSHTDYMCDCSMVGQELLLGAGFPFLSHPPYLYKETTGVDLLKVRTKRGK